MNRTLKTDIYLTIIISLIILLTFSTLIFYFTYITQNRIVLFSILPFLFTLAILFYYLFFESKNISIKNNIIIFNKIFLKPNIHKIDNLESIVKGAGGSFMFIFNNEKNERITLYYKNKVDYLKQIIKYLAETKRKISKDKSGYIVLKESLKHEIKY